MGKENGILIIDPPRGPRKITNEELKNQEHWNVVGISKHPIITKGQRIGRLQEQTTAIEKVSNEFGGLRFDSAIWDFGTVKPGDEKTYEFSFENNNNKPITLSNVKANCACLKVVDFTKKVAPGEKGVIKVLLATKSLQGNIAKKIIGIINNDNTDENQQFLLKVFGEVSRRGELLLRPSEIHLPDFVKGSKMSASLTLSRIGFDKLFLEEIKPSSPVVSTKITDVSENNPYEANIDVQIEAQGQIGPFEHQVLFETDNAEHPTAKLRIYGNIIPHIKVQPPEVFLGLISPNNNLKKTIILKSETDTSFTIKNIKLTTDAIIAKCQAVNKNKTLWHLTLTTSPILKEGLLMGKILLNTDDPNVPIIEIPFTGLVVG